VEIEASLGRRSPFPDRNELVHDGALVERFKKEVVNAKRLGHANVVRVFDIGEHEGRSFLSMELVNGPTLRGWLKKKKSRGEKVTASDFMRIAIGVSEGLSHIHDHDIVHRDIKPENIKIEPSENPKIMDLGISKLLDYEIQKKHSTLPTPGTLSYMPPEQKRGEPPSFRDDVFACGAVFYEMLTGENPRPGISLKKLAPHVPSKVAQIVDCCLDENPQKRFAHGGKLAAALRKAEREGFWDGTSRKQKVLFSAVGLLFLVVIGSVWYYRDRTPPRPLVVEPAPPPVVESRPAGEILRQAEEYIKAENYGPAIPLLEKLRDYQDGIAFEELGSIYHMEPGFKDLQKALTCYEEAYRAYHRRVDAIPIDQRDGLIRPKLVYNLVCVESVNGDAGAALARLEEFVGLVNEYRFNGRAELAARLDTDPELDNIRQLLRFREIRQTIRLHHPE
jgi:serine/threonine protein kinase